MIYVLIETVIDKYVVEADNEADAWEKMDKDPAKYHRLQETDQDSLACEDGEELELGLI